MGKYLIIIATFFTFNAIGQQDVLYTQFMYNKLGLNPAYAGKVESFTMNAIHRDQWTGLDGAPQAQALSLNFPSIKNSLGLGVNFSREIIGVQEKLTLEGNYAYQFNIAEGSLSMGLSVSGRQFTNDFSDPRLVSIENINIDPAIDGLKHTRTYVNAGAGFYFRTNTYYFGLSVPRLIEANIDFEDIGELSRESRHLYAMTGVAIPLKNKLKFTPQVLFKVSRKRSF